MMGYKRKEVISWNPIIWRRRRDFKIRNKVGQTTEPPDNCAQCPGRCWSTDTWAARASGGFTLALMSSLRTRKDWTRKKN